MEYSIVVSTIYDIRKVIGFTLWNDDEDASDAAVNAELRFEEDRDV